MKIRYNGIAGRALSTIRTEFEEYLARVQAQHARTPLHELMQLLMLALEREEIVSIGYRESILVPRLERLEISNELRAVIRHALNWIWKDEEMHAIFLRGALLRLPSIRLHTKALFGLFTGAVGGWAASVRQHAQWKHAPFSKLMAGCVTALGAATGKIPSAVRKHIQYSSLHRYWTYNAQAEETAWLCWRRIVDLSKTQTFLSGEVIADFERIAEDEKRHRQVFEILLASFDENDRLKQGREPAAITRELAEVSRFFVPRRFWNYSQTENPIGSGGKVIIVHGGEKRSAFQQLLDQCGLKERLLERAESLQKTIDRISVSIKPTFMMGYNIKDISPLTDAELLTHLCRYLRELGCRRIKVIEGRNIYDRFYKNRTVHDVANYLGVRSDEFEVVDATEEQVSHQYARGLAQYSVSRTWKEADFRISFSKMRSHPVEQAYLSLANVEWLGARCEEFLFVERQAHRETAIMMLLSEFPPHFALIDAYENVPDGLLGVMGCPSPKTPRRFYAGTDALAVDIVAARHMGVKNPRASSILRTACYWFGDSSDSVELVGPDEPIADWKSPYHNELSTILSFLAYPVYTFGSGRGALFVPEMDTKAFPLVSEEGWILRSTRRLLQSMLGLRLQS